MNEIIIIYILKRFDESVAQGLFSVFPKILMVENQYVDDLVKIFGVPKDQAIKCLTKVAKNIKLKLFILNLDTIYQDINDQHYTPSVLRNFVKALLHQIIDIKFVFARQQQYEKAAKLRDVELKLMAQYNIKKEELSPL